MQDQHKESRITQAAIPVVFSGTTGHFMPAADPLMDAGVAVLFVNAWGFEEMSSRRFFRSTADQLSENNIPSFRFDYPGAGDALDLGDDEASLRDWQSTVKTAAQRLHQLTHYRRLVVMAQGLGTMLAAEILAELPGLAACVFVNPVTSGRKYLRELSIWSSVIDGNLEIPNEQRDKSPGSIAGLHMPAGIALELKARKLGKLSVSPDVKFLIAQPKTGSDDGGDELVSQLGIEAEFLDFVGFREMIANVTISRVPTDVVHNIAAWIASFKGPHLSKRDVDLSPLLAGSLVGDGFEETPIRFGAHQQLSGTFCRGASDDHSTVVLFLTTAYERHASWGRIHLQIARSLAADGIASLRFDAASVGDSPPRPGAPEQILYSDWLTKDVREAVDYLEARGFQKIVLAGRCSGGYVAFQAALQDPRVTALVTVNQDAFFWPKGKPVDELLKFVPRDFRKYATKLFDPATLKRLFRGEIYVAAGIRNSVSELLRRFTKRLEPVLVLDRAHADAMQKTRDGFQTLAKRNVGFSLIYGEGDIGLRAVDEVFGQSRSGLNHYGNLSFEIVPDCDHNLTLPKSRDVYRLAILSAVSRLAVASEPVPERAKTLEIAGAIFAGGLAVASYCQTKLAGLAELIEIA